MWNYVHQWKVMWVCKNSGNNQQQVKIRNVIIWKCESDKSEKWKQSLVWERTFSVSTVNVLAINMRFDRIFVATAGQVPIEKRSSFGFSWS